MKSNISKYHSRNCTSLRFLIVFVYHNNKSFVHLNLLLSKQEFHIIAFIDITVISYVSISLITVFNYHCYCYHDENGFEYRHSIATLILLRLSVIDVILHHMNLQHITALAINIHMYNVHFLPIFEHD